MTDTTITLGDATVEIDPMIYGQYLEHVEDCVDPGLIGDDGLHLEVIEAARDLQVPVVRWPGGCFADLYDWRDGIGPVADRPVRRNWHWGGDEVERNRFGTHEFLSWCEQVGAEPYINVNLGTGTLVEALRWLDHCNGTATTADVEERRRLGREEPWQVRYWGIGNETWGHWEAGRMSASRYADVLDNWADFFKRNDPSARIIGVGSSGADDREWDETVLERAGTHIDLLSLHLYGSQVIDEQDRLSVVHNPAFIEKRIGDLATRVRDHNARRGTHVAITMDEWNIRHYRRHGDQVRLDRSDPRTGVDALFAAGVFHAMIRQADVVRMANYVFLVNGNGVLRSKDGTVTTTALAPVFRLYRELLIGQRIDLSIDTAVVPTPAMTTGHPDNPVDPGELPDTLPIVDAVAARQDGRTHVAVINRSDQPVSTTISDPSVTWRRTALLTVDDHDRLDVDETDQPWQQLLPAWSITFLTTTPDPRTQH